MQFFETMMGKKFYEGTSPRIAAALENIANELKRSNDLKEKELSKDEGEKSTNK